MTYEKQKSINRYILKLQIDTLETLNRMRKREMGHYLS